MSSFPTFGIFVFLSFAYCTHAEGGAYRVVYAIFESGERYTSGSASTILVNVCDDTYNIEVKKKNEKKTFGLDGMDTMIGKDVVLRTNDNLYVQLELNKSQESELLFIESTRSKLREKLYTYKLAAVYEYQGPAMDNVSISGFKYSTHLLPRNRYIIHATNEDSTELKPRLLWTADDFNYIIYDEKSIILTLCRKPKDKSYKYYLVTFADESNLSAWLIGHGKSSAAHIPSASTDIQEYYSSEKKSCCLQ